MKHTYMTKGTCSRRIDFELDGNKVKNVVAGKGTSCADQLAKDVLQAYSQEHGIESLRIFIDITSKVVVIYVYRFFESIV